MPFRVSFFAVSLSISIALRAQTLPTTAASDLSQLLNQLDADDFKTRQLAEDQIVAMGEPIRPAISAALPGSVDEKRSRLQVILHRLDVAAANTPTLITVKMTDASPRDIFASIAKQSGVPLPPWPDALWTKENGVEIPKVSIDIRRQPFWAAIKTACQACGATADMMNVGTGPALTVEQGGNSFLTGPWSTDGLFVVVPLEANRNAMVSYSDVSNRSSSSAIQFKLLADPKAKMLSIDDRAVLEEAVDDKEKSLRPAAADSSIGTTGAEGMIAGFTNPLQFSDDGYSKMSRCSGSIGVLIAKSTAHLEIADLSNTVPTSSPVGHWTLQIAKCRIGVRDGEVEYKLNVGKESLSADAIYTLIRQIRIIDANGQSISSGGNGSGSDVSYDFTPTISAEKDIKLPVKLIWDVPTDYERKRVAFHFSDLPLPVP